MKPLFLFLMMSVNVIYAQNDNKLINMRTVTVSGEGKLEVKPNKIDYQISFGEYFKEQFEGKPYTKYKTKIHINDIEKEIIAQLKDFGIKMSEIKLIESSSSNWYYGKDKLVHKTIQITFDNLDEPNQLNNLLNIRGINHQHIARQTHTQFEQLEDSVKVLALHNAKKKAEMIAKTMGYTVIGVISIHESGGYVHHTPVMYAKARNADSAENVSQSVEYENYANIELNASYQCVFEIK